MLKAVNTFLNEILLENLNISLFFVSRKQEDKNAELIYTVYSSTISKQIGIELFESAKDTLSSLLGSEPEYIEYGILSSSERKIVEYIPHNEVPYLIDIINQIADTNISQIENSLFQTILGYIVRIENKGNTLYLIKKNTPKKLMQQGKIMAKFKEGDFSSLDSDILTIEKKFDAIFLQYEDTMNITEKNNVKPENIFILTKFNFESFFNYINYYQEKISNERHKIDNLDFICALDGIIDYCQNHGNMVRKLARLLNNNNFSAPSFSKEKVQNYMIKYKRELSFDSSGKLVLSQSNMWELLHILDQDYASLELTNEQVEIRSKSKLN